MLKLNDGKHSGRMRKREAFPQAARALAALQRQQGLENTYIPKKTNESDNDHPMKNCDQILDGKVAIGKSTGRRHHLHLQQIGGNRENGTSHNKMNGKMSTGGQSVDYSLFKFLCKNLAFWVTFRVQSVNVTHATGGKDRTPRPRDADAHFFSWCAHATHHQRTYVGSRLNGQGHVDCLSLRAHQKPLIRLMFRGTLLESQFSSTSPFSSFCSTPLLAHFLESKNIRNSARKSLVWPPGRAEPLTHIVVVTGVHQWLALRAGTWEVGVTIVGGRRMVEAT